MIDNKKLHENTTKSSEFVCSAFGWKTQDSQKEIVERLENIETKRKDKKKRDK